MMKLRLYLYKGTVQGTPDERDCQDNRDLMHINGSSQDVSAACRRESMGDWNLIVIGKVLGGLSITAAGVIMAATILGFSVPYGPFLILTCTLLMLASAGLVIIRYQQCGKKTAPEP